jgi:hypothetical protein
MGTRRAPSLYGPNVGPGRPPGLWLPASWLAIGECHPAAITPAREKQLSTWLEDSRAYQLRPATKQKYRRVVEAYLATGHNLTDAAALSDYALQLSASGRAHLKAAIKLWTVAALDEVKAVAIPQKRQPGAGGPDASDAKLEPCHHVPAGQGNHLQIY